MEDWISGSKNRTRQQDPSLTPASDVLPRDICKYTLRTNPAAFLGRTWENMKTWIDISIIIC